MKDTSFKSQQILNKMMKDCSDFKQTNVEYSSLSTNPENQLSISVIAGEHDWYRARVPYKHLGDCNASVNICCYPISKQVLVINGTKFIIIPKLINENIYKTVVDMAYNNDSIIIFDLDDNYHHGDPENPNYHYFDAKNEVGKKNIENLEKHIKFSDYAFYSTRELMAYYKHLNPNCMYFPNYLDIKERYIFENKFNWREYASNQGCSVNENSLLIGFFGSSSHVLDLNEIMEPVIQILREYDNVFFACLCEFDMAMNVCFRNNKIPANKFVYFDSRSYLEYPKIVECFDIGLAPVKNTVFGRCKSPLKLMEYGAFSIPYVASKVANNQRFHIESKGVGGYISSSNQEWYINLKSLIEDSVLRKNMGENLKEYVYNNCDVSNSFQPLVESFDTIYFNKKRKFNHPTPYDLADSYDGIPEVKTSYTKEDICPCGSGDLYVNCKNNCYPAWGHVK